MNPHQRSGMIQKWNEDQQAFYTSHKLKFGIVEIARCQEEGKPHLLHDPHPRQT